MTIPQRSVLLLAFHLMKLGGAVVHPDWLTVLPGCLIAGIGLGITNAPVTNMTTSSVSSDRAGMASGIDMSARMVSLAINIALMGFILPSGALVHLKHVLPGAEAVDLRLLAERSAGAVQATELSGTVAHQALVTGFGWVMLYAAIGAWPMAGLSFSFSTPGPRSPSNPTTYEIRGPVALALVEHLSNNFQSRRNRRSRRMPSQGGRSNK